MTNILIALSDADRRTLAYEAETAKRDVRGEVRSMSFWDGIVAAHGNGKGENNQPKRADIIAAVLDASGLTEDKPQRKDGKRTPYGNVVQLFGYRFDSAVKRAAGDDQTVTDWMRLVKQAAENAANKGGFSAEAILAAIADTLGSVEESDAA